MFQSIIKATEKFPGGGGIWSPGMDLWWGIWTAFRPREGGIWAKIFQKFKCPGVCPRGDVEASIWLVHDAYQWYFLVNYVYMPGWYALSWSGYCTLPNWLGKHRKYPRIRLITHWVRKTFTGDFGMRSIRLRNKTDWKILWRKNLVNFKADIVMIRLDIMIWQATTMECISWYLLDFGRNVIPYFGLFCRLNTGSRINAGFPRRFANKTIREFIFEL